MSESAIISIGHDNGINGMDRIVTISNFNSYTGRYSLKKNRRPIKKKTDWYIEDNLLETIPVLALRNRGINSNDGSPVWWKNDRNLRQAIVLTMETLKAWQAFRPEKASNLMPKLEDGLPRIVLAFQRQMAKYAIETIWDIMQLKQDKYNEVLRLITKTVSEVSSYKSVDVPMLGSKIMHFLFPEFFPVWDTAWIMNECLINEPDHLGCWLPNDIQSELKYHSKAASMYSYYFALMMNDLNKTRDKEYSNIEEALIRHSGIPREVIDWHFYDISPIVYEFCLLGKHIR